MAKKKHKPVNHKHAHHTHFSNVSQAETLEARAKQSFKEQIRSANENENIERYLFEGLDYDPVRKKRRIQAVLGTLEKVTSLVGEHNIKIPEVFTVENEWIDINAYPLAGYDLEERYTCSAFAAAIWMLDQLSNAGELKNIGFICGSELSSTIPLVPDVWDLCHSSEVIHQMMNAIYLRNGNNQFCSSNGQDEIIRIYMSENLAKGRMLRNQESNNAYHQVLSLIPQQAIETAIAHYEQVYWDWVKRYFQSRLILAEVEDKYQSEFLQLVQEAQSALMKKSTTQESAKTLNCLNYSSRTNLLPLAEGLTPLDSNPLSLNQFQESTGSILKVRALRDSIMEIGEQIESFWHMVGFIPQWTYEQTKDLFSEEIADIWKDFDPGDPYEMAFAFMYLLDNGSDLPWCYFPGTNIHTCCAGKLPWTRVRHNSLNDGIFNHYDPESGDIKAGPADIQLPKRIKVPELEDWYKLSYINREEESPELYNLAQVIYEATGCMMPRKLDRYVPALKTLDKYGITGKKALHNLLYCMTLLGESRYQTSGICLDDVLFGDEEEESEQIQTASVEELQKQIASLKKELQKQKQQAYDSSREARDLRMRYESMAQLTANDVQELHDLRELIFHQQEGSFDTAAPSNNITFPYMSGNRIVVFGGHDSWSREIKPKLPNVRFVDRTVVPNANLIRNADIIWIQTNAMCHPHFYKIVDEAKKYSVPIRYFSYASPIKCAEQLVMEDRKLN